jgi:hypothetical protein
MHFPDADGQPCDSRDYSGWAFPAGYHSLAFPHLTGLWEPGR